MGFLLVDRNYKLDLYYWFLLKSMHKVFRGLEQVLLIELGFTKEHNNFMYILLAIVCKWKTSYAKDYKKI